MYMLSFGGGVIFFSLQKGDVQGPHHELRQKTETNEWEVAFDTCSKESKKLTAIKPNSRPDPTPYYVTFISGPQFLHL